MPAETQTPGTVATATTTATDLAFGPTFASPAISAFWAQHTPVVQAWIASLRVAGDPWWRSAVHAAFCLVSYREFEAEGSGSGPNWHTFDVERFLFHDLHEGGTVTFFGSAAIFFDQLVDCLERFAASGIVNPALASGWLAQMRVARPRFLAYYGDDTAGA